MKLLRSMISKDEIAEILETLKRHRSRTILTAFGVFWGVFMLLLLLGSGSGLEKGITNLFDGYNLKSFHLYSRTTKIPYAGIQENRNIDFTTEDLMILRNKYRDKIEYIAARSYSFGINVKNGELNERYDIFGVEPEMFYIRNINLKHGRYVNILDIKNNRPTAIIGIKVAEELYGQLNPIGKTIQIGDYYYKISGIFESLREGEQAEEENKSIQIPHSVFQANFGRHNNIDNIGVISDDRNIESDIINLLKRLHKIHPEDNAIYSYNTWNDYQKYQGLFSAIRVFIWIIGIGTLMSGVVGVSNIMVISIKERTKEIGIRKAIGATPYSIIKMIILESVFLTGVSGYIGLSVVLLLISGVNYALDVFNLRNSFFVNPEINLGVVISALVILMLAGFFAAFLPARKAALIKPIVALRDEG